MWIKRGDAEAVEEQKAAKKPKTITLMEEPCDEMEAKKAVAGEAEEAMVEAPKEAALFEEAESGAIVWNEHYCVECTGSWG